MVETDIFDKKNLVENEVLAQINLVEKVKAFIYSKLNICKI